MKLKGREVKIIETKAIHNDDDHFIEVVSAYFPDTGEMLSEEQRIAVEVLHQESLPKNREAVL